MENPSPYFTAHIFKKALSCPSKLYYYSHLENYPRTHNSYHFTVHNSRMQSKLRRLARAYYPEGMVIKTDKPETMHKQTLNALENGPGIIYNGHLIWANSLAEQPIIEVSKTGINLIFVKLKVMRSQNPNAVKRRKLAFGRWRRYVTLAAFNKWVFSGCIPSRPIRCTLILPDGNAVNEVDQAYQKLEEVNEKNILKPEVQKKLRAAPKLIVQTDITEYVDEIMAGVGMPIRTNTSLDGNKFDDIIKILEDIWINQKQFPPPLDKRCKNCEFRVPENTLSESKKSGFAHCWSDQIDYFTQKIDDHHILSLSGHGKQHYLDKNIYSLKAINVDALNMDRQEIMAKNGPISQAERQYFQVRKSQNKPVVDELVKDELFEELNRWEYPVHFIDFEAATLPVPVRKKGRPYEMSVFQYSCHTIQEDETITHSEWLNTRPGHFPNFDMVSSFLRIPDIEQGTLVQFSPFEKNAFKTIRKQLMKDIPLSAEQKEMAIKLHKIISRHDSRKHHGPYFADFNRILNHYYYNSFMSGKLGMKDILAAIFKMSPYLKKYYSRPRITTNFGPKIWWNLNPENNLPFSPYDLLDSDITEGSDAFAAYGILQETGVPEQERAALERSLKQYCELDTLGLVMIYQHFKSLSR